MVPHVILPHLQASKTPDIASRDSFAKSGCWLKLRLNVYFFAACLKILLFLGPLVTCGEASFLLPRLGTHLNDSMTLQLTHYPA